MYLLLHSPIFTDAINNTGLATVTYLNDTSQQVSLVWLASHANNWF